jgi:hypothetical protein
LLRSGAAAVIVTNDRRPPPAAASERFITKTSRSRIRPWHDTRRPLRLPRHDLTQNRLHNLTLRPLESLVGQRAPFHKRFSSNAAVLESGVI